MFRKSPSVSIDCTKLFTYEVYKRKIHLSTRWRRPNSCSLPAKHIRATAVSPFPCLSQDENHWSPFVRAPFPDVSHWSPFCRGPFLVSHLHTSAPCSYCSDRNPSLCWPFETLYLSNLTNKMRCFLKCFFSLADLAKYTCFSAVQRNFLMWFSPCFVYIW